ncbi:hypothetical protein HELRODRAFT_86266 [Helobdella robusta]|uniref:Uncharacterized protein n=1 Tax=Helobdella robusta TaxID=6412 RepID=T1G696_HELRO|nr:hypothetical protein HELRODRAFT_86266 [Helobdella robusta]ESN95924.1 hypothetical protein HELRODRAFT_86266 [Helobdella robusta]
MGKIPTEYSHQQLVDEMAKLSKLPMEQRMKIAKNKRLEQLKLYQSSNSNSRNNNRYVDNEYVPRKGSNRETKISFDKTALLFDAAAKSDIKEVRYLITTGNCDKDATNCHGMTVLHQSCVDHNLALIHILIKELRADVMKADHEMWTPLHTAALLGYADIAKFLLDNGADPLSLNAELNMPYDICDDPDTLDIIELIFFGRGVTQNRIEELRNKSESAMLSDLTSEWNKFGRLSFQGDNGETLVRLLLLLYYYH